ncbi:discoidin domain-containing protein [Amycolatopsis sp. NPDC051045]|uniref:discoidin domain-containing protein n=1 Tax=Amycolatopsis sp. NPDC051045 TaxID=3156922 RepID=UPI00341344BA
MLGVEPDPQYGYSLWALEVHDGDGPGLALAGTASASSATPGKEATYATDGSAATRWAVSTSDRSRTDNRLAVDLGAPRSFDRVRLSWEAAAGRKYRIETSPDGTAWTPVADHPVAALRSTGGRLDVDGRAGIVVAGPHPLTVTGDRITLSDGPAAPLLAELYPGPVGARPSGRVATTSPAVHASVTDGFLVLVNLSAAPAAGTAELPQERRAVRLYRGEQEVTATGTTFTLDLAAAEGRIEPPRFTLRGPVPGVKAAVDDDPATAWRPGPGGRMVVDLGTVATVSAVELTWTPGRVPAAVVETSVDGITYGVGSTGRARYVAVRTQWRTGHAGLTRVSVRT